MKKIISKILAFLGALVLVFSLVGCGVNQKYADKIDEAAKNGEHLTYEEVTKKLGDATVKGGASVSVVGYTGTDIWYDGCDSLEEAREKYEAGKTVKMITVIFLNGKAVDAEYSEWVKEEK